MRIDLTGGPLPSAPVLQGGVSQWFRASEPFGFCVCDPVRMVLLQRMSIYRYMQRPPSAFGSALIIRSGGNGIAWEVMRCPHSACKVFVSLFWLYVWHDVQDVGEVAAAPSATTGQGSDYVSDEFLF